MSDTISTIKTLSFNNNVEDEKIKEELKKNLISLAQDKKSFLSIYRRWLRKCLKRL